MAAPKLRRRRIHCSLSQISSCPFYKATYVSLLVRTEWLPMTNPRLLVWKKYYISPCDQVEANTQMHASNILEDKSSVTLRTVDTDVLVLAVA